MSNRFRRGGALFALAMLSTACTELSDLNAPGATPAFTIVDGAHGGNGNFFFLPPMVPAPGYSGTFDGSQSPVVQICELTGNDCGTVVTTFSGSAIKVDLEKESYGVLWKTRDAGLDPSKTYRISVLVGSSVLGFADVVVLANGSQIRTVDRNQFAATINGGALNIRFRIERSAPPPPPCSPECTWENGEVLGYSQFSWGEQSEPGGALLYAQYDAVYASTLGEVEVGIPGVGGYSIILTGLISALDYVPSTGPAAALTADLIDPLSSVSGVFGGEVFALRFNIDFSDAGHLLGTSGLRFGDLLLCGLTGSLAGLNGQSVRAFSSIVNTALGGGSTPYTIAEINQATFDINNAFNGAAVSPFGQQHLRDGSCT